MTIACAGGYYKNGAAATATANLTLAAWRQADRIP
jgi:hypothetical protein